MVTKIRTPMNPNTSKLKIAAAVIAALALFYWDQNYRGDTQPFGGDVANAVFENSYLTSSDGDRIYSYCFGSGGGIYRGHPCIYIVNYYRWTSDKPGESCYIISYLPEANYGATYEELPENRRFFPYESTLFEVEVCGRFQMWDGSKRGNGQNIDDWEFQTEGYPSEIISADLRSRGYQW